MSRILITGASGMIGRALVANLAADGMHEVIATDLAPADDLPAGVAFHRLDVTGEDPARVLTEIRPEVVVHLASIVTPAPGMGPWPREQRVPGAAWAAPGRRSGPPRTRRLELP